MKYTFSLFQLAGGVRERGKLIQDLKRIREERTTSPRDGRVGATKCRLEETEVTD